MSEQEPAEHFAEKYARENREHTVVAPPESHQSQTTQLWDELQAVKAEYRAYYDANQAAAFKVAQQFQEVTAERDRLAEELHDVEEKLRWWEANVSIRAMTALQAERDRLQDAIREHRAQKADDRLYAALGDGIKCDRRVGDKAAMLWNCERFIDQRCQPGERRFVGGQP